MADKNLYAASNQWATRPNDERFWTMQEMRDQCYEYYVDRTEYNQQAMKGLHFGVRNNELDLSLLGRAPMRLSNWGFNQLCSTMNAPASYLSSLPASHTATLLNHHV